VGAGWLGAGPLPAEGWNQGFACNATGNLPPRLIAPGPIQGCSSVSHALMWTLDLVARGCMGEGGIEYVPAEINEFGVPQGPRALQKREITRGGQLKGCGCSSNLTSKRFRSKNLCHGCFHKISI